MKLCSHCNTIQSTFTSLDICYNCSKLVFRDCVSKNNCTKCGGSEHVLDFDGEDVCYDCRIGEYVKNNPRPDGRVV